LLWPCLHFSSAGLFTCHFKANFWYKNACKIFVFQSIEFKLSGKLANSVFHIIELINPIRFPIICHFWPNYVQKWSKCYNNVKKKQRNFINFWQILIILVSKMIYYSRLIDWWRENTYNYPSFSFVIFGQKNGVVWQFGCAQVFFGDKSLKIGLLCRWSHSEYIKNHISVIWWHKLSIAHS
jgi:hypothetical protein